MRIELKPDEGLTITFEGLDGEITVRFVAPSTVRETDGGITVETDWPDASGRQGVIYFEPWGREDGTVTRVPPAGPHIPALVQDTRTEEVKVNPLRAVAGVSQEPLGGEPGPAAPCPDCGTGLGCERCRGTGEVVVPTIRGKVFCFTGTLPRMSRDEAQEFVLSRGGSVCVLHFVGGRPADYLVAGDKPGSKLEKARGLGVPVISEDDLLRMGAP